MRTVFHPLYFHGDMVSYDTNGNANPDEHSGLNYASSVTVKCPSCTRNVNKPMVVFCCTATESSLIREPA